MSLDEDARTELGQLEAMHRLRVAKVVDGPQGVEVTVDGRAVVSFASNDYLGLAGDPRLAEAAIAELERSGSGAGASRLVIGNLRAHEELELAVRNWLRVGGARVFGTGYSMNVSVMSTLAREGDVVVSDALNHASLIDGCRLSKARVLITPHLDLGALERALEASGSARRRIVVTESLFSMDGDVADLVAISAICRRYDAVLIVDEAHAVGAMGPEGRGLAASVGVVPDVVVGTFGKALGSFGAFAASTAAVADLLWNRARSFVFSTGLPPAVAATNRAAVGIVRSPDGEVRRNRLTARASQLREMTGATGIAHIAPIVIGDDRRTMETSASLLAAGLLVQGIRPPTVPEGTARLRISVSATHTAEQVSRLALALAEQRT